jgi:molecular chaperone HscA
MGVDLGTSNTVAVVRWPDGRTRALLFDGAPVMPSAVYLDEAGVLHVGRDALRLASLDPGRLEPNPKRRVSEPSVLLGAVEVSTVDLLAAVLGAVARAAVEAVGFLPPAALTYPAAWGARRREVLAAAAVRAGWPPARFIPEPVAAAGYFAGVLRRPVPVGGSLAVFDFGGGTLDIAVVRNTGSGFQVIGDGGLPDLGGLDVDSALVTHLGSLLERTQPTAWAPLASTHPTVPELRLRRAFWEDVRGAKEMLSRTAVAPVAVPNVADAVHLTREELDRIAGPLLQRAVQETAAVIGRCGLRPDQLAGLFLVGGSSRMPIVARLLHSTLGVAPTVLEQPELPVAEGAILELVPPTASAAMVSGAAPVPGVAPVQAPPHPGPATGPAYLGPVTGPAGQVSVPIGAVSPVTGPAAAVSAPPGSVGTPPGTVSAPPGPVSPVSPPGLPPDRPGFRPGHVGEPGSGAARPWYRRPLVWIPAAALLAVALAVTAVLVLVPGGDVSEVPFTSSIGDPFAVVPGVTVKGYDDFTVLTGDRLYFGAANDDSLTVGAYDIPGKKALWTKNLAPTGSSISWQDFWVQNDVVLVTVSTSNTDQPYVLYGLDGARNGAMWSKNYTSNDGFLSVGDRLVFSDDKNQQLHFLDPHTSDERGAALSYPKGQYNQNSTVYQVLDDKDLRGPANFDGVPPVDSDSRIVQIGGDSGAHVIDVDSGKEVAKASNIDQYGNKYLAYNDRFFVADVASNGYKLFSYPLADLKDPKFLRSGDGSTIEDMEPCGGQVCVLDQTGSDDKTMKLRLIDPGSGEVWSKDAAHAKSLVPVGDRVMVSGDGFTRLYQLKDGTTEQPVAGNGGPWVRVNASSLLFFSQSSSNGTQGLTGYGIPSKKPTSLGELHDLRTQSCSWNEKYFACVTDTNVSVWKLTK